MDWLNSKHKFIFAERFLEDFKNLNELDSRYLTASKTDTTATVNNPLSDNTSSPETDTKAILHDLNRYVEAYILLAKSSLDALAREIFEKFNLTEKNGQIRKDIYFQNLNEKIDTIHLKNNKVSLIIKNFIDKDYEEFNLCRVKIAHEVILDINCAFSKTEILGKPSRYRLTRPISLPEILKSNNQNAQNLDQWLEGINIKIKTFLNEIEENSI